MIINIIFIYTLLNFLVLKFNKGIVMRKTKFIAICLSVCVANYLFAAEHKDNNETRLDGVVVSASGFSQEIKEAPASISVIKGDELTKDSFTSLH